MNPPVTRNGPRSTCTYRTCRRLCRQVVAELREFPPRMKPGSFSLDRVMEAVSEAGKATN